MLLSKKLSIVALLMSVAGFVACTDDEATPKEPVQPTEASQAAQVVDTEATTFAAETIYFDFDDYTVKPEAQGSLKKLADHMTKSTKAMAQIEGHCDERGSHEYNLALGERRANAAKQYLQTLGVDAGRVTTISYGEEKPAAEGHDESAWGKNRRDEFVMSAK